MRNRALIRRFENNKPLGRFHLERQPLVVPQRLRIRLVFVVDFKSISAGADSIFHLIRKGTNKRVVPEKAGDIRHPRPPRMVPGNKRFDLSIDENERRFGQPIIRPEHHFSDLAPIHLDVRV